MTLWALNTYKYAYKFIYKRKQKEIKHTHRGDGNVKVEVEMGDGMLTSPGMLSHKMEKTRNGLSCRTLEGVST